MKFAHSELSTIKDGHIVFDEKLDLSAQVFGLSSRLRDLQQVRVEGEGRFDSAHQLFYVNGVLSGLMIVPCAITLEDVDYPFVIPFNAIYSFEPSEDEGIINAEDDEIDLMPLFYDEILTEIPLKVVKPGLKEYPKGEGWEVVREDEYEAARKSRIDPRLEKLKEFNDK